jgi:1,4-dihydroxy-2-naphthoate octaprenyltransferase
MTNRPQPLGHLARWWLAIRPKTLSAASAPVIVGAALAAHDGALRVLPALGALVGALLIQIGTNLANDVLDFRRGADHERRLGPTRVVQAGLLSARSVAIAAALTYAAAAVVGSYLATVGGWPILAIGATGIASGILYTAGPWPLAYVGLGDVFVLIFFGLAAVGGTYYVQSVRWTADATALGLAVGALAVGILAVNNLRDVETDGAAGKRTLAVRIGPRRMRIYYPLLVLAAFAIPCALVAAGRLEPAALLVLAAAPLAVAPVRKVAGGVAGAPLNRVLAETSRLEMGYALALSAGLLLGGWQ